MFNVSIIRILILFLMLFTVVGVASATDYYVTTSGSNSNSGQSEGNAWRTISYAAQNAYAGDVVHIKSGNYGREYVVFSNSGTATNQIVFEGYGGMPMIEGSTSGTGLKIRGKYITIKNIRAQYYSEVISIENTEYVTLDNVDVRYGNDNGIWIQNSRYITVENSNVQDSNWHNINIYKGDHNTVKNTDIYAIQSSEPYRSDYGIIIVWSSYNTVDNVYVENKHLGGGHGIVIKDNTGTSGIHSHGNVISNVEVREFYEPIAASHGSYDNLFENSVIIYDRGNRDWNHGIAIRDGAHDNTFRNIEASGFYYAIYLHDTVEAGTQEVNNNLIENSFFYDTTNYVIGLNRAHNNVFNNNVFDGGRYLFRFETSGTSDNTLTSSIVTNIGSYRSGYSYNPTVTYTNFYGNGFSAPSGTGNSQGEIPPQPTPDPTPDPESSGLISNLVTTSGKAYVADTLSVGKLSYIDRSYQFTTVPSEYTGLDYIITSSDDRYETNADFLQFDVNSDVTVYVAYDDRISPQASWLSSYTDIGDDLIRSGTATFSIYAKTFPSGHVSIGGNSNRQGNSGGMYVVIVEPQATPTPLQTLDVSISGLSDPVMSGETSQVTVQVTSGGIPVDGATVDVSIADGSLSPASGPADTNGDFITTCTVPTVTTSTSYTITATASKTGYTDGTNTDQITVDPKITELVISNLVTASGNNYVLDTLGVDKLSYIDRNYKFTSVPSSYTDLDYIITASSDRYDTSADFLQFDVNKDVTVFVAYDDRISPQASWLSSFTDTGDELVRSNKYPFSIYEKTYPAGHVSLGGNSNLKGKSGGMYFVIVK